ncbi:MAG: tail fiber domain-containing protein, partial [Bdellovibrionales bacterium]
RYPLYVADTGTSYFAGSVGIGTATPRSSSKLDVNGMVYVGTFTTASSTAVCQNGNVLSYCSSSRRFKENIKPMMIGLKDVLDMKPITFDFKGKKEGWDKHDFGFIAEEMLDINPLFATYDEKGEISGVRYPQLIAVLAKAIQELKALFDGKAKEQDARVDKLENMVRELSATVKAQQEQIKALANGAKK